MTGWFGASMAAESWNKEQQAAKDKAQTAALTEARFAAADKLLGLIGPHTSAVALTRAEAVHLAGLLTRRV